MTDFMDKNTPTKAGLYFARRHDSSNWYHLVVCVGGEAPFLRVEWTRDRKTNHPLREEEHCFILFGPEIVVPEIPTDEIRPPA